MKVLTDSPILQLQPPAKGGKIYPLGEPPPPSHRMAHPFSCVCSAGDIQKVADCVCYELHRPVSRKGAGGPVPARVSSGAAGEQFTGGWIS